MNATRVTCSLGCRGGLGVSWVVPGCEAAYKAGTTSIQTHLAALLGKPVVGGYWYPVPGGRLGPGHADLARACLKEARPVAELDRVIATAQAAQVGTLVLTSQEFAHAFPVRFARLKNVLEGHEIHLVVTLNEIGRRAGSIWQELAKHRHVIGLEKGIEQILSREPATTASDPRVHRRAGAA
jgi:hypothetical protein